MSTTTELPRWDMSVVYPSLQSEEFTRDFAAIARDIDDLTALFDRQHIGSQPHLAVDDRLVATFDAIVNDYNALLTRISTLSAYIGAFVATDSRDSLAQARRSELQQLYVRLSLLGTRFTAWLGSLDIAALEQRSRVAREHQYMLRTAKIEAEHQMSPGEEALAAELEPSGGSAWARLHSTISSQLMATVEMPDGTQELPMTVVRNLAHDADREIRRAAHEGELAAWQRAAVPLAAALNSIKGEVNVLSGKRGWPSALDAALFGAHIDRATLDAMLGAARESFPVWRRYLHAKARALGLPVLAWYDLFAPVGKQHGHEWSFDEASRFVIEQYGRFSPRMGEYAARAFREHWIDAEPRAGKQGGAFCMPLRNDESRVLANFEASYEGMSTLAHELGHGYHNLNLAPRTMLQRDNPMTLAETASTFAETVVRRAALAHAGPAEQLEILEASLQGDCQIVVDITSRFIFEQTVFERRRERELSIDELNEIMLEAQRDTYGDGLDAHALHPYMWAVKGHYYSTGLSYYNFPYMFGMLFGVGLYAHFQRDPERFRADYDALLSSTGMEDAAPLAQRFGIDIRSRDFWRESLAVLHEDVDRFVALVDSGQR